MGTAATAGAAIALEKNKRLQGSDLGTAIANEEEDNNQTDLQLKEILYRDGEVNREPTDADLDRAWTLFNKVIKQHAYAADVFNLLARSSRNQDQTRALVAFRLTEDESRTGDDYESAVRVAVKTDNYRMALRINEHAVRRNLQQRSSVFLLLHAVTNELWNTARKVSKTFFQIQDPAFQSRAALAREVGNYRDLPLAIYHLGSRLRERAPVIMQHSGTLQYLFRELLAALVRNGQLMSIITPQGLQNLFEISHDMRRAVPSLYVDAIRTINKDAMRPDKGSLADMIYTNLRSDLPEFPPEPHTFGSLFSIHAEQGASAQKYNHYLDEFAKFHGAPDRMSFQKVLSALAAQGDIDGVQRIFLRFSQTHGLPTDPALYTPLLYAYARLGDVAATERELGRMIDYGVQPTTYVWNILIHAHARSPEPRRALDVLDKMKNGGVIPDAYTFTTLVGIYARIGDTDNVLDLLEQAQENQVRGSYALVTGLVQSYCLNDQAEAAEKLAETATNAKLQGNATTMWNYLLRHYAFLADSKSMLRVQEQMNELDVPADSMTHAAFMTALVVFGRIRDAVQILRTLNLSQTLAATSFHYAIILHGFAQEGDRDMANVVYQEMIEIFPRLGASPRLAMLHLQARRSPIENERPMFAAQYLEEILHELSMEDRASRQPQPGLRRRPGVEAVPSLYVEYFVDLLVSKGQFKRAEKLANRFETLSGTPYLHLGSNAATSIQILNARMIVQAGSQTWEDVEVTWERILQKAIKTARRAGLREEQVSHVHKNQAKDNGKDKGDDQGFSKSAPMPPVGLPESGLMINQGFKFGSMIADTIPTASALDEPGLEILYAQRYLLEIPLTRYLDSLAVRQLQNSAIVLVAKLEKVGFALTSKNWNMYIQALARSNEPEHWTLACEIFEQKMIPSISPWPILQRGYWLPPRTSKGVRPSPVRRKVIEKRNPGQLMATYYTAVHLASVLLKANRLVAEGDSRASIAIRKTAPLTWRYIRRMPYLKDRIQGLLLRDRKLRILPPRRPRFHQEPDRSGVLQSKSPVDHLPASELLNLEEVVKHEEAVRKSPTKTATASAIQRAELVAGQIPRTRIQMEKRRAMESAENFSRRVKYKEGRLLRMLRRIRRDAKLPRTVSDSYIGHPVVPKSVASSRVTNEPGGSTLFGRGYQSLPVAAQNRKRLRERSRALSKRIFHLSRKMNHSRRWANHASE
ncbi:hypothetical protein H2200_002712 [Cladophialophora chaetospira]|uniref:Uncharacterized protein n=1 Tax=Cladophialophora chaetospira TaxID=386627 RepID=A0AA38XJD4_9EURO|nr:hypothetical protein H2200_002712 [Cladophialophora chaetospira]